MYLLTAHAAAFKPVNACSDDPTYCSSTVRDRRRGLGWMDVLVILLCGWEKMVSTPLPAAANPGYSINYGFNAALPARLSAYKRYDALLLHTGGFCDTLFAQYQRCYLVTTKCVYGGHRGPSGNAPLQPW